jgi:hypothetical protein
LWHVSDRGDISRFEPHRSGTAVEREPLVWAVDTRHLPLYWFPRQCPRGTFWAGERTGGEDESRFLAGDARVHVVERPWLPLLRVGRVFAYRLPEEGFAPHPAVGGYWVCRETVRPLAVERLGDLVALHETAGIALRVVDDLRAAWHEVGRSTLEYSGIRLRNAGRAPAELVAPPSEPR